MKQNLKVNVFVPSTFGENTPAESALVASVLERVQKDFCIAFGGCTTVSGYGQWVNDNGQVISEPVNIVSAYTDVTLSGAEFTASSTAQYIREELDQTCVLWSIENSAFCLEYA